MGNRLTRTVDAQTDTYTYVTGKNRLDYITGPNAASYSYDANGNITGIDTRTFVYNQNNRLIRVEEGAAVLGEYTYNGLGQRAIKDVDGVTTVFVYDFDGNIVAESLPDGTITTEYLYMGSNRLVRVDVSSGDLYFYSNNYLGTPLLLTDDTGRVVWDADYQPFGEAAVNSASTVVNDFRFAGQYFDQETGLHYNYHRYYDPKTGRYLTPDPIGLAGGINLFIYAYNNPINAVDPLGLLTEAFYHSHGYSSYDIDYGSGGWTSPPSPYNPSHNIFRQILDDAARAGFFQPASPEQISNNVNWWIDKSGIEAAVNSPTHPINWEKNATWFFAYPFLRFLSDEPRFLEPWGHPLLPSDSSGTCKSNASEIITRDAMDSYWYFNGRPSYPNLRK